MAVVLMIVNFFGLASNINSHPGTDLYLIKICVTGALTWIVRMLAIDIYLPFSNIARWVSLKVGSSNTDNTGTGTNTTKKSGKIEESEIEMSVEAPEPQDGSGQRCVITRGRIIL